MPRFFVQSENIGDQTLAIEGSDVNHIRNVLRMKPGDELTVSDGGGMDYFCRIADMNRDRVMLDIVGSWKSYTELPVRLYLFQGLPKADKMDLIVQKAVELGAYEIVPVRTARTIVKLDGQKEARKLERWNSISESAAKQAGRAVIPKVHEIVSFEQAVDMCRKLDAFVMPYEKDEGMEHSRRVVRSLHGVSDAGIFIGPEGGFADEEVRAAVDAGAKTISLGSRILRTATAGMAVLSVLMFELETDRKEKKED